MYKLILKVKKINNLFLAILLAVFFTLSPVAVTITEAGGGGLGGGATEWTQIMNNSELAASTVYNSATAASTGIIQGLTTSNFNKEFVLDGIAWTIAKRMVSQMTQSLVNWINSGFEGSPAFITDLNQLLVDTLDQVAGEYIHSLGGLGEFICSPFRLDVQAALTINYAQQRSGMPSGPSAPSCTASGIADNIEGFLKGVSSGNNMQNWFQVVANPQNTPYGAYLEADAKLQARLVNAAGQELQIANWSDGFLSKKVCDADGKNCTISTPGKVISEALTFQLSTGPRSLIEADEINEIIGALLNQLTLKAVQGINGLLGMSGGTGYTDYSYGPGGGSSYTDALSGETDENMAEIFTTVTKAIKKAYDLETDVIKTSTATLEKAFLYEGVVIPPTTTLSVDELRKLPEYTILNNGSLANLQRVANDAYRSLVIATVNQAHLDELTTKLDDPAISNADKETLALKFMEEQNSGKVYHSYVYFNERSELWSRVLRQINIKKKDADDDPVVTDGRTPAEWFEAELAEELRKIIREETATPTP